MRQGQDMNKTRWQMCWAKISRKREVGQDKGGGKARITGKWSYGQEISNDTRNLGYYN